MSSPTFLEAVRPLVDVIDEVLAAADEMIGRGVPAADSVAMAELAAEGDLADELWPDPVHSSHAVAGLLRHAAADHLRSYGHLFASEPVPVYSHLAVARAMLEAAGQSYWLSDPHIGATARVQRYEAHRLKNAAEMKRGPNVSNVRDRAREVIANVEAGSASRSWRAHKKSNRNDSFEVGGESLPSSRELIEAALAGPMASEGLAVHAEIAQVLWWYFSGASHGAGYALNQSIELQDGGGASLLGPTAAIFTKSGPVLMLGVTIVGVYTNLVDRHATLFGYSAPAWVEARATAGQLERATFESHRAELRGSA